MTSQRATVDTYLEGFRASDHRAILECLTDDITWVIHGHRTTRGKAEFNVEIANEHFEGSPALQVDRTIENGNVVVVTGEGRGSHRKHGPFTFAFNDVFTFRDGLIEHVESYVVPFSSSS